MWIVDSKSENATDIEIEECEEDVEDSKYILTEKELQTLIDLVACDVGGDSEYGNNIVSDYFNTETKRLWRY